jgi:hypothetical protein
MKDPDEIEKFVRAKKKGTVWKAYEANRFDEYRIWEVWVKEKREFKSRFVVEHTNGDLDYYNDFQPFINWVESRRSDAIKVLEAKLAAAITSASAKPRGKTANLANELNLANIEIAGLKTKVAQTEQRQAAAEAKARTVSEDLAEGRHTRMERTVRLAVASIAFLASIAVLLYLVAWRIEPNAYSFSVFASLIASGATLFYGAWRESQSYKPAGSASDTKPRDSTPVE